MTDETPLEKPPIFPLHTTRPFQQQHTHAHKHTINIHMCTLHCFLYWLLFALVIKGPRRLMKPLGGGWWRGCTSPCLKPLLESRLCWTCCANSPTTSPRRSWSLFAVKLKVCSHSERHSPYETLPLLHLQCSAYSDWYPEMPCTNYLPPTKAVLYLKVFFSG